MANISNVITVCDIVQQWSDMSNTDFNTPYLNLKAFIPLIYAIPSLILSLRLIIFLISERNKEFSSSFYTLFIVASIVEFNWYILNYYTDRFASAPLTAILLAWIPKTGFITSLLYFAVNYLTVADMLIPIMLSSNRMTALAFPIHHKKIWSKITKPIFLFFFLAPIPFTYKVWSTEATICPVHNIGNKRDEIYYSFIQAKENQNEVILKLSMGKLIVSFASAIICLGLNAITVTFMFLRRKRQKNIQGTKQEKGWISSIPELKLFALSLLMFFNEVSFGAIQLGFYIANHVTNDNAFSSLLFEVQRYVIDIICLTPPWFLLFMSGSLRKKIFGSIQICVSNKTKHISGFTKTAPSNTHHSKATVTVFSTRK